MNTYKKREFTVGGGHSVWLPPIEKFPIGGQLDLSKYPDRPVTIPAGSMVYLSYAGGEATIVGAKDADMLDKVNALTQNDIVLDEHTTEATVTCVYKGQIYTDYIDEVPASVQKQLAQITFVNLTKPEGGEVEGGTK